MTSQLRGYANLQPLSGVPTVSMALLLLSPQGLPWDAFRRQNWVTNDPKNGAENGVFRTPVGIHGESAPRSGWSRRSAPLEA